MEYEVLRDKANPGDWRVEAVDYESEKERLVTIFSGGYAEDRAQEYAAFKNGQDVDETVDRIKRGVCESEGARSAS